MSPTRKENPLKDDLDHILQHTENIWTDLRGERIFITGGTGFFGRWLMESLLWANDHLDLNVTAMILTRHPRDFIVDAPRIANHPAVRLHRGDIRNFTFPEGEFSHIIHAAATSAYATFHNENPLNKFDTIVQGTRRMLEFAVHCGARKFLYTSSGAVYGPQPEHISHLPEEYNGAPSTTDIASTWGISKRAAELLCTHYQEEFAIEIRIARCFSFVGPHLPLDLHYAIGNFIRDGLAGGPIRILGDGTPVRSYLYSADLAIWLWTILLSPEQRHMLYNVGSERGYNLKELAQMVADSCSPEKIEISVNRASASSPSPRHRYIPSTARARTLGLNQLVDTREAIRKTMRYHLRLRKASNYCNPAPQ